MKRLNPFKYKTFKGNEQLFYCLFLTYFFKCTTGFSSNSVFPSPITDPCPVFETCCQPNSTSITNVANNKNQALLNMLTFKDSIEQIAELIDRGDVGEVLAFINDNTKSGTAVYNYLLNDNYVLSDLTLMAAIEKSINPLSNYELMSLIVANSPVTKEVYDALDNSRPIVANNYTVWMAQQNGMSEREVLEAQINDLRADEDANLAVMINALVDEGDADGAIAQLLLHGYKEEALPLLVDKGDYTLAQNLINSFDDAGLRAVYSLDLRYKQNGISLKSMQEEDKANLLLLSGQAGAAGLYSRSLLAFVDNIESFKTMPTDGEEVGAKKTPRLLNYENFKPESEFAIFPNPCNGNFTLISYLAPIASNSTMQITDITGKLIQTISITTGKKSVDIQLNKIAKGIYNVTIYSENIQVFSSKLSVYE